MIENKQKHTSNSNPSLDVVIIQFNSIEQELWQSAYQKLLCLGLLKHVLDYNECRNSSLTKTIRSASDCACNSDNAETPSLRFDLPITTLLDLISTILIIILVQLIDCNIVCSDVSVKKKSWLSQKGCIVATGLQV